MKYKTIIIIVKNVLIYESYKCFKILNKIKKIIA